MTLTFSVNHGNLLIAFLALFVAWSGNFLWDAICFVLHRWHTAPHRNDSFCLKNQTILRSGLSSSSALPKFIKIFWSLKPRKRRKLLLSATLIVPAVVHILSISTASILSSRLANPSNEVLLVSPRPCGWVTEQGYQHLVRLGPQDLPAADALFVSANWYFQRSLEYAKSCYSSPLGATSTLCDSFVEHRLHSSVDRSAPCPFKTGTCRAPAISFDTGMIEANRHLGVNVRHEDSLSLRKITTCAPIHGEGVYDSGWTKRRPVAFVTPPTNREHFGPKYPALYDDSEYRSYYFGTSLSFGNFSSNATFTLGRRWLEMQNREYILTYVSTYSIGFSLVSC